MHKDIGQVIQGYRPGLLDMLEELDSVQWNSVGIIPIDLAHVNN